MTEHKMVTKNHRKRCSKCGALAHWNDNATPTTWWLEVEDVLGDKKVVGGWTEISAPEECNKSENKQRMADWMIDIEHKRLALAFKWIKLYK